MSKGEQKRIFVTGATGYIGRVVTELAVGQGYNVHGLSRNEEGDARLRALGATPVRGELTSLDVLRQESSQADAVLHLAFIHDFGMGFEEVLRIDSAAVDALAEPLRGTDKALVITSGTLVVEPDPAGGETTEDSPPNKSPLFDRIRCERQALGLSKDGVRVIVIRLPPYVYGRGGRGFLLMLMQKAVQTGESVYVDNGSLRTTGVYVDDAATLYLLAARDAKKSGDIFNGSGSTSVTLREMAEAIGTTLKLPVRSVSREEAVERWGPFLTAFVQSENLPSNRKAIQQLGWQPKGIDMLTDLQSGSYREVAEKLLQGGSGDNVIVL